MLRLSRDLRPRGILLVQLVSYAMDAMVLHAILDSILPRDDLTPEQCDRILGLIQVHDQQGLDSFQEAARTDYLCLRNAVEDLSAGRVTGDDLNLGLSDSAATRISFELERAELNRLFSGILRDAERPYHELLGNPWFGPEIDRMRDRITTMIPETDLEPPIQHAVVCLLLVPAMDQAREAAARYRTRLGAVPSIIAVRRFQLVHGRLPQKLEEALREVGVSKVPLDPYDGKPLKYVILDGRPVVYSVARDQLDQGGRIDWNYMRQPGDLIFSYDAPTQ
jgi:hypothetical protein